MLISSKIFIICLVVDISISVFELLVLLVPVVRNSLLLQLFIDYRALNEQIQKHTSNRILDVADALEVLRIGNTKTLHAVGVLGLLEMLIVSLSSQIGFITTNFASKFLIQSLFLQQSSDPLKEEGIYFI